MAGVRTNPTTRAMSIIIPASKPDGTSKFHTARLTTASYEGQLFVVKLSVTRNRPEWSRSPSPRAFAALIS